MALPCGVSSSMPATAGISLSPPIPIERRTGWYATVIPWAAKASSHARVCASLLSTRVPSTSRITAAPILLEAALFFALFVFLVQVVGIVELVSLVADAAHLVRAAAAYALLAPRLVADAG